MLDREKTELESLGEALEACSEVRIRVARLAKGLQGSQKNEAVQLMDAVGILSAILMDTAKRFECALSRRNKIQQDTAANHW